MEKEASQLQGNIDGITGGHLKGWVFDSSRPNHRVSYFLEVDGDVVFSGIANSFRQDLIAAGIGDGSHGFSAYLWEMFQSESRVRLLDESLCLICENSFSIDTDLSDVSARLLEKNQFTLEFLFDGLAGLDRLDLQLFCGGALVSVHTFTASGKDSEKVTLGVPRILFDGFAKFLVLGTEGNTRPLWTGTLDFQADKLPWSEQKLSQHQLQTYATQPQSIYRYRALANVLEEFGSTEHQDALRAAIQAHHCLYRNDFGDINSTVFDMRSRFVDAEVTILIDKICDDQELIRTLCSIVLAQSNHHFQLVLLGWEKRLDDKLLESFPGIAIHNSQIGSGFQEFVEGLLVEINTPWVLSLSAGSEVTQNWLDALLGSFDNFSDLYVAGANPIDSSRTSVGDRINGSLLNESFVSTLTTELHPAVLLLSQESFRKALAHMPEEGGLATGILAQASMLGKASLLVGSAEFFPPEPLGNQGIVMGLQASGQKTLLLVDYETPKIDIDAGSYAAIQEIKILLSFGYRIRFLPITLSFQGDYSRYLMELGVEVLTYPHVASVEEAVETALEEGVAGVFITRFSVAERILPVLARLNSDVPVLLNNADLHFLREMRAALSKDDPGVLALVEETRRRELEVYRQVDCILCYTELEKVVISSHLLESAKIFQCPWVAEIRTEHPTAFADRHGIAFLGGFRHEPNILGLQYFVEKIMPSLVAINSDFRLYVYGSHAPEEIWQLASPNVEIVGYVENLETVFSQHRVFVGPLTFGSGLKGKVVESMAWGLPCVLSKYAAEGTGLVHQESAFIADTVDEWLEYIGLLYTNEDVWGRMSQKGLTIIEREYSFSNGQTLMKRALEFVGLNAEKEVG